MSKLKQIRKDRLLSKLELARQAGVSAVTIDRIEQGYKCRVSTKRKILKALGISVADREIVFEDEED